MARHVDSTVHMFDEWGLPMMKNEKTGRYLREGKWQIMIHGESYKPIVAEAAKKSANKIYNRIMVTHLLMDDEKENRIGGAVGFNMRTGDYHVFKAKAVIVAAVEHLIFLNQEQLVKEWEELGTHLGAMDLPMLFQLQLEPK